MVYNYLYIYVKEEMMIPQKIKLWESADLTAIKTDKFKTGMISFSFSLPLDAKLSAYNLMLGGVLRRGSVKYPSAAALNRRLDELYASSVEIKNLRCGKNELLIFSSEMLDNAFVNDGSDLLDGVLELISELIMNPVLEDNAFPKAAVDKERVNVSDAIKAEINNPRVYASRRCAELMHSADTDFPTVRQMAELVDTCDGESLYKHYIRVLSESKASVFYIGSEDIEDVAEKIKSHFSPFGSAQNVVVPMSAESFEKSKEVTEDFPVSQGKLCMGFRIGVCADSDEYFAAALFNEIFGGSPASKLFMNVREKMGLCYYCSSAYDTYMGNVTVSAGIDVSDLECAKAEILRQLEDMKAGRISEVEITAAKKSIANWYRQMLDYPFELFAFYSTRGLFGRKADPEEYMRRFDAVTPEQIVKVAKRAILDTVYFLKGTIEDTDAEEVEE